MRARTLLSAALAWLVAWVLRRRSDQRRSTEHDGKP